MKKPLTQREKRFIPIIPAGLILLLYALFGPGQGSLKDLEDRVEREANRAVQPGALDRTRAELVQYREERRQLLAGRAASGDAAAAEGAIWSDSPASRAAVSHFQMALNNQGLLLLEERLADAEDLRRLIGQRPPQGPAQLWELQLAGRFTQIRELMTLLADAELPPLPFGLELDPQLSGDESIRIWRLWLWR